MDTQTCKHCSALLYGETRCSSCGKLQVTGLSNFLFSLVFVLLLLCGIFGTSDKGDDTSSPDHLSAATLPATEAPIIPTPNPEYGWTEIQPYLWAKAYSNTNCHLFGNGLEDCAGQIIMYYSTVSGWVVYYEAEGVKTWITIFPDEVAYSNIPIDATLIRWESPNSSVENYSSANPPNGDTWKPLWEDFLYGRTSSDCLSSGTQFCAGETVEYHSKRFLLLVWQTPRDDRVETKINPGYTTVNIPKEATSIHWEYNFGK